MTLQVMSMVNKEQENLPMRETYVGQHQRIRPPSLPYARTTRWQENISRIYRPFGRLNNITSRWCQFHASCWKGEKTWEEQARWRALFCPILLYDDTSMAWQDMRDLPIAQSLRHGAVVGTLSHYVKKTTSFSAVHSLPPFLFFLIVHPFHFLLIIHVQSKIDLLSLQISLSTDSSLQLSCTLRRWILYNYRDT